MLAHGVTAMNGHTMGFETGQYADGGVGDRNGDGYTSTSLVDPFKSALAQGVPGGNESRVYFNHNLDEGMPLWPAEDVLNRKMYEMLKDTEEEATSSGGGADETGLFVRFQEKQIASVVKKTYKRMPPVLNENSLFTRAATFGACASTAMNLCCMWIRARMLSFALLHRDFASL